MLESDRKPFSIVWKWTWLFSSTMTANTRYIYGSAEVVGLMLLEIIRSQEIRQIMIDWENPLASWCGFSESQFSSDIKSDFERAWNEFYFPGVGFWSFPTNQPKSWIERYSKDFDDSLVGSKPFLLELSWSESTYLYYQKLFDKIQKACLLRTIIKSRIRIPKFQKDHGCSRHLFCQN